MCSYVTKMRAVTHCNPDFYLMYLLLLKNSGECYCQNKDIGVDCTKHNLALALLDCVCIMQNHPCVRFCMSTWSQFRGVVTRRTTRDILAFSCDDLFFFMQGYYTLSEKLKKFLLFLSLHSGGTAASLRGIWLDGCTAWAVNKFCCNSFLHTFFLSYIGT